MFSGPRGGSRSYWSWFMSLLRHILCLSHTHTYFTHTHFIIHFTGTLLICIPLSMCSCLLFCRSHSFSSDLSLFNSSVSPLTPPLHLIVLAPECLTAFETPTNPHNVRVILIGFQRLVWPRTSASRSLEGRPGTGTLLTEDEPVKAG